MSTKAVTSGQQAALAQPSVPALVFVQIDAPGGTLYLTSAPYDWTWNGHTWLGLGQALQVDAIAEKTSVEPVPLKVTLQGATQDLVSLVLTENLRGSTATVWIALLDANYQVVDTPPVEFVGRVDHPEIDWEPQEDGTMAVSCSITVEQRLLAMMRRQVLRYTDADQQRLHPGDTAGRHLGRVNGKSVVWPSRTFFT